MSNFSTIFDQLVDTTIPALTGFSSKKQLVDPYNLEENDINLLRNGWGIRIGDAEDSPFQEFKFTRVIQEISIVLTREVKATEHNKTPLETATKALIEDAVSMRVDFYNADQLTLDSNIENIVFNSRSGVEFIDETNVVFTVVSFNFEIKETI